MSHWHEPDTAPTRAAKALSTDVVFKINCARLPVDHVCALSHALCEKLPWLPSSPFAGIQAVHVAASQNGWERPLGGEWLHLAKRTRLRIRVQCADAERLVSELCNQRLLVDDQPMQILSGHVRDLTPSTTLFARYASFDEAPAEDEPPAEPDSEAVFVDRVVSACKTLDFTPNKVLCGKTQRINSGDRYITTRSVLLADVPIELSLLLQDGGIGDRRLQGCGILIPHKDTAAVQ